MTRLSQHILDHTIWEEFLAYKTAKGYLPKAEEKDLRKYIKNKEYLSCAKRFIEGISFSHPTIGMINKQYSNKKRTVYLFPREENYFLKFISFYLIKYDHLFSDVLCSFRGNNTVKTAIASLKHTPKIDHMYSYKVDIRDYFNSVDISLLLPMLEEIMQEDSDVLAFIRSLLEDPYAYQDNKLMIPKKGIMAGMPISSFLANLFLKNVDKWFFDQGITYFRYSDDIIIFADSQEKIDTYAKHLQELLNSYHLDINPSKEVYTKPKERWEFLGFSYHDNKIDISSMALNKLKKKMKRKARAIYRWKIKNHVSDNHAIKVFIRSINQKLFDNSLNSEITWCRWYFPVINTDQSLRILDAYMQDCIRYVACGNYSKKRYTLRYQDMKDAGYVTLVNRFYRFLQGEIVKSY